MPMPNDRAGVRGELRYGCSISPGIRGLALEFMSLADLDEKLTQYPAGATFRWQSGGAGASMSSEERDMRVRVQALLMKHGMTLLQ
jgi:hypothetical protein